MRIQDHRQSNPSRISYTDQHGAALVLVKPKHLACMRPCIHDACGNLFQVVRGISWGVFRPAFFQGQAA